MEDFLLLILGGVLSAAGGFFAQWGAHIFTAGREREQREYQEKQRAIERQIDRLEHAREEIRDAVAELRGLNIQLTDNDMAVPNENWRYAQTSAMSRFSSAIAWINDPELRKLSTKQTVTFWSELGDDRTRSFDFGLYINRVADPAERRIAEMLSELYQQ